MQTSPRVLLNRFMPFCTDNHIVQLNVDNCICGPLPP